MIPSGSLLKVVAIKLKEAYGCGMSRPQKQPLRALTEQEQVELAGLARAWGEPAAHVARARALLAVSAGASFTEAARAAGRKSGDGVAKLVGRFNTLGLAAVAGRRPSGRPPTYDARQRERILAEARRAPVPAQDGTASWSLSTLQRALRRAPDGLPRVSTHTLWAVLRQAGYRFGRSRSWCPTGKARRKRKSGVVEVIDPDATAKKN
jgi:transposase